MEEQDKAIGKQTIQNSPHQMQKEPEDKNINI
jgi:hypothetical protein